MSYWLKGEFVETEGYEDAGEVVQVSTSVSDLVDLLSPHEIVWFVRHLCDDFSYVGSEYGSYSLATELRNEFTACGGAVSVLKSPTCTHDHVIEIVHADQLLYGDKTVPGFDSNLFAYLRRQAKNAESVGLSPRYFVRMRHFIDNKGVISNVLGYIRARRWLEETKPAQVEKVMAHRAALEEKNLREIGFRRPVWPKYGDVWRCVDPRYPSVEVVEVYDKKVYFKTIPCEGFEKQRVSYEGLGDFIRIYRPTDRPTES